MRRMLASAAAAVLIAGGASALPAQASMTLEVPAENLPVANRGVEATPANHVRRHDCRPVFRWHNGQRVLVGRRCHWSDQPRGRWHRAYPTHPGYYRHDRPWQRQRGYEPGSGVYLYMR